MESYEQDPEAQGGAATATEQAPPLASELPPPSTLIDEILATPLTEAMIEAAEKHEKDWWRVPRLLRDLKNTLCFALTMEEYELFIEFCRQINLNPLTRQVFAIPRNNKDPENPTGPKVRVITYVVAIDGLRLIAARTEAHAGTDDPVIEYDEDQCVVSATVTVYRIVQGLRCSFVGTARYKEFKPASGQDSMWIKMPAHMTGKCAEAQALRKAFPAEMSALYTIDEMQQVDRETAKIQQPQRASVTAQTKPEAAKSEPAKPEGEIKLGQIGDQPRGRFKIVGVGKREGTGKKGAWTLHLVNTKPALDPTLSTFSADLGAKAEAIAKAGTVAEIEWEVGERGSKITSIKEVK